jgi:hypothetical protein
MDHVNPTLVGLTTFACTLAAALLGMWLRPALPVHHLSEESRDTMKLGIGLIATMTALVLGLVTASAKNSFDTVDTALRHAAMDILTLDRLLARYGPETADLRATLKRITGLRIRMMWPERGAEPAQFDPPEAVAAEVEGVADHVRRLSPRDDAQRSLQGRALDLVEALLKTRWLASASGGTSVPPLFLTILLCWLTITFATFGVFAPRNATVLAVLVLCALSVSSALFLILEMDGPFDGVLVVSSDSLRYAHAHLNR